MIKLASLDELTWQHPSQWRGRTDDDRPVYVRYKWGELLVHVGKRHGSDGDVFDAPPLIHAEVGGSKDSQIDWCDVMAASGIELTPDLVVGS